MRLSPSRFWPILLGTLLTACGTMEVNQARDTEQLLAAAGFRVKLADTPEKLAHAQ